MSEWCWLALILGVCLFLYLWHWLGDKTEELEQTILDLNAAEARLALTARIASIMVQEEE